jgi:hypothetical protein
MLKLITPGMPASTSPIALCAFSCPNRLYSAVRLREGPSGFSSWAAGMIRQFGEQSYAPPIAIQIRASTITNAPHRTNTHPMARSERLCLRHSEPVQPQ